MPQFIALPVGQGDAFYLDTGEWSVLVDGGRAKGPFGSVFQTVTRSKRVDVLVCTHNDADHANGVLGFLESGLACSEVWLPGRWLGVLPLVLQPFVDVFITLAEEAEKEEFVADDKPQIVDMTPLEQLADRLHDILREREPADGSKMGEDGWPENLHEALERTEPWHSGEWEWWEWAGYHMNWPHLPYPFAFRMEPARFRLLWSAIEAAHKIRAIAVAAFHRGIPIRWFEYDASNPGGGYARLQPLNARAITHIRPVAGPLLRLLALTVSNKESLVFWSPPADGYPGILFNADSDLTDIRLPSANELAKAIATAPHHGSEANSNAYRCVQTQAAHNAKSITWIRSDGRYRSRPGHSYLHVQGRRLCTLCRLPNGATSVKQSVRLFSNRNAWNKQPATTCCKCQ